MSRAAQCLLGQIAGDNLGALVEFKAPAEIAKRFPKGPLTLVDGGVWNILAGQPTDDSEMALALARVMVAAGGWDETAVIDAYVRWRDSRPFDMGSTTRAALSALVARSAPQTGESQANGAMMRACPIGIAYAGRPDEAAAVARRDAALTHPHPVCQAANAAYAAAIAVGVAGGARQDMLDAARGAAVGDATVLGWLDDAEAGRVPADYTRQMGWVRIALTNAFATLASGAGMQDGVVATVRRGGDTDTNAAICGALIGAVGGRVPDQWRDAIRSCRPGPGTRKPRPQEYWPDDAEALAEALAGFSGAGAGR